ncbi:nucleoside-diphosphate kinase [Desulfobacca acetoxidans]|uniref:Nucleoside diphosphate kinase n=1 Tax=Desulfobacca acetoxidans (strain ATCC 700848 / DSM 11109 / ASRB2) TaxID=880072 RepID=F2NEZ9_DESAR|nr:nucleoside-diphosphate kinase [Desulfobacca acetoxidans]AEB08339.1 Nucleoside diphosphate kinase [Desulfobacca acetoxidans DSM 11109]
MVVEQTLSLIKPDGVARGLVGEVIGRFERAGLKLKAMKMLHLTKQQAQKFYEVHQEKKFFDSLTDFMSSGPIVAMILEGQGAILKNRELMGDTDYQKAAPGTIRADFARDIEANIVHGSDAPDTAEKEINFFFNELERI